MIRLIFNSAEGSDVRAEMEISVSEDAHVDFVVLTNDGKQYDFTVTPTEWNLINEFVFEQIKKQKP